MKGDKNNTFCLQKQFLKAKSNIFRGGGGYFLGSWLKFVVETDK